MAGDWLKIEATTPDKPEVFEIAVQCKIEPTDAFGRCFLIWRWFDSQTEDGNAANVTTAYLDRVAGVAGFAEAMRNVGWLTGGEDCKFGISLPNFDRHNGKTAKSRALTAKRVATHKKRKGNVEVTQSALPREEKRRSKNPVVPFAFERFWLAFPKRRNKGQAERAWKSLNPDEQLQAQILAALERATTSADWRKEDGRYIPYPATWLNAKGWEDDLVAATRSDGELRVAL